jgi:RHS repeat-associated protein
MAARVMGRLEVSAVVRRLLDFFLIATPLLIALPARADKSGVTPQKVSLPGGAGTLEGVGENVEPNLNMGLMTYRVPVAVPKGYAGVTPELSLVYNSGAGNSEVGLGWSLSVPSIERMTSRGLPRYTVDDTFVADGSDELTSVGGGVYRARFERGFVRYRWRGRGSEGYWIAEYPDGRRGYFGADSDGNLIPEARVAGGAGTFRYQLVEVADVFGHELRYEYRKSGDVALLSRVSYVFENDEPRYEIVLGYEARQDHISDAKSGVELRLTERLSGIQISKGAAQVRRYVLCYGRREADRDCDDAPVEADGLSRLRLVRWFGLADEEEEEGAFPVAFGFDYSEGLASTTPEVVTMGRSPSVDWASTDLVDLDSDSLPDLVDTSGPEHLIYLNELRSNGSQRFAAAATSSRGTLQIASPSVEMFDLDGNGLSDMVDAASGAVLLNQGTGDWERPSSVDVDALIAALGSSNLTQDPNVRFLDYDGDKLVDLMRIDGANSWVLANRGGGAFELIEAGIDVNGASMQTEGLELGDMNGDGLQDLVLRATGFVSYRMNLGLGRFSAPIEMENPPTELTGDEHLVDLDGDSLADLVRVQGIEIFYVRNLDGRRLGGTATLDTGALDLPEVLSPDSVRFADMNGSGSTDIVFTENVDSITYLEIFPERPNILTSIENGIGKTIQVVYGASAEHYRRDGSSWTRRLPHPMLTVDEIVVRNGRSGVEQRQRFHYSNGYYDGEERQFRGFEDVVVETDGDDTAEHGTTRYHFDVGASMLYRKGLLIRQETESAGELLRTIDNDYVDCPVAEVDGADPAVQFACPTESVQTILERQSADASIRIRETYEHDGYGNRTLTAKLGVVPGPEGCTPCGRRRADVFGAACGDDCVGDESYEETLFVTPGSDIGQWIVGKPERRKTYGIRGSPTFREEMFYYDDEALPGVLTRGLVTKVRAKVSATSADYVDRERSEYDDNGAVLTSTDANDHQRTFEYDSASLLVTAEEVHLGTHSLRMTVGYHPVLDTIVRTSSWSDTNADSAERATEFAWDDFGRLLAVARPGDTLDAPTETYEYALRFPVSSITRRTSSRSGERPDLAEIQCFDGLGRKLQTRTLIEAGRYQVSGFTEFNVLGQPSLSYFPHVGPTAACDEEAPENVLATRSSYDATGRVRRVVQPDEAISYRGVTAEASVTSTEYFPLRTIVSDPEDNDPGSPHNGTPTTTILNGLGQTVLTERLLAETVDGERLTREVPLVLTYTELGQLRGYVDTAGNEKVQEYDLLDRITKVTDPDSHETGFELDPVGNVIRETDARGVILASSYDAANRLTEQWEESLGDDEAAAAERKARTLIVYAYDSLEGCELCTNLEGRLARVTYPTSDDGAEQGEDLFGYDERGQSVYSRRVIDGHVFDLGTELDNAGRVVAQAFPGPRRYEYELDGGSRLTAVPGYIERVLYEERGLLRSFELSNGARTDYIYDAVARLSSLTTTSDAAGLIQDYGYARDRVGNILSITDSSELGNEPSAAARYEYDSWYRLLDAYLDEERGEHAETLTTRYDDLENITRKESTKSGSADHVGSYIYGEHGTGPHAVTTAGDFSLGYDLAGNMTSHSAPGADDTYTWDFLGRLITATRSDTVLGRYTYGPDRQRIKKVEDGHTTYYVAPNFEVRDGTAILYVTLGDRKVVKIQIPEYATTFLADLAPGTAAKKAYTPEPDGAVNAADAWAAQAILNGTFTADVEVEITDELVDDLLAASTRRLLGAESEEVTYLHHNHLGTTAATTDSEGDVVQRTEHYPYGVARYASQGWEEEYGYTGKERDADTELCHFGARYYHPRIASWTSVDPASVELESLGARSTYAIARHDPINWLDPDGLADQWAEGWKLKFGPVSVKQLTSTTGATKRSVSIDTPNKGYLSLGATTKPGKFDLEAELGPNAIGPYAGARVSFSSSWRADEVAVRSGLVAKGPGVTAKTGSEFGMRFRGENTHFISALRSSLELSGPDVAPGVVEWSSRDSEFESGCINCSNTMRALAGSATKLVDDVAAFHERLLFSAPSAGPMETAVGTATKAASERTAPGAVKFLTERN